MDIVVRTRSGEVLEALDLGARAVDDLSAVWREARPLWHESRRQMFATQGAATGEPWGGYRSIELQYTEIKGRILGRRISNDDQLRWEPGVLERLAPSLMEAGHELGIYVFGARDLVMGSRAPGAADHDDGTGVAPEYAGGYAVPQRRTTALGGVYLDGLRVIIVRRLGQRIGVMRDQIEGARVRGGGVV